MKKYIRYGLAVLSLAAMTSCKDTLDTHPTTIFDENTVWSSKSTADAFVNATYNSVLSSTWAGNASCVGWEARTPNGVQCSQVGEGIDGVATELGISAGSDFGTNRFALLRKCNLIIKNAEQSAALSEVERKSLTAQGRFLRGLVFFDQARKMGRFVPVTQVFSEADSLTCKVPMTKTVDESYQYVIADLEYAAENLPVSASAGIANKYAAEVFLSRAALQAYAYTEKVEYLDKAIKAANDVVTNCKLSSEYGGMFNASDANNPEILLGYYRLSTNTTVGSYDEMVRIFPNITPADTELSASPHALANSVGDQTFCCWAIYFPTQDLVDQYLVKDEVTGKALPWYETSQYKNNVEEINPATITQAGQVDAYNRTNGEARRIPTPQDLINTKEGYPTFVRYAKIKAGSNRNISDIMYSARDKRFATSIAFDGATWLGEKVEMNLGGNLSQGVRDKEDGGWYNTVTGYYWRKSSTEAPNPRAFYTSPADFHFTLARVGEAYMNLAEAYLLKGNIAEAVKALNATRVTHGGLAPSTATSKAEAWKDYIRERRVEMANEGGDIYFSYLRWGKYGGDANHDRPKGDIIYELDAPVHKVSISRDRKQVLIGQFTLMNSASRMFTQKRYLMPIAKGFLDTREAYGMDHAQNEGW
uniref:RagB/SusD family nutrient uptake outer membrane protein n=1 Tax=Prevotella sp. GTC17259 TaxID=3236795 RepID=A0AB33JEN6_9BACT